METKNNTVAYFCPECGSPNVRFGALYGSNAACFACEWEGPREKLAAHNFFHESGSDLEVLKGMLSDMRKVYGECARPFGLFLRKWGFFDGSNTRELSRYIAAMAKASFEALIETRAAIDKERVDGN